jgi:hypothetical protein
MSRTGMRAEKDLYLLPYEVLYLAHLSNSMLIHALSKVVLSDEAISKISV